MTAPYREFHGIRVPDPFRWLEDAADPRVQAWVQAQQARTDAFLRDCSELARCREFMARSHVLPDPDWRCVRGTRSFRLVRRPRLAQPVLVVGEGGAERTLVDPNPLGKVLAADTLAVSPDGHHVAYTLAPPAG